MYLCDIYVTLTALINNDDYRFQTSQWKRCGI